MTKPTRFPMSMFTIEKYIWIRSISLTTPNENKILGTIRGPWERIYADTWHISDHPESYVDTVVS